MPATFYPMTMRRTARSAPGPQFEARADATACSVIRGWPALGRAQHICKPAEQNKSCLSASCANVDGPLSAEKLPTSCTLTTSTCMDGVAPLIYAYLPIDLPQEVECREVAYRAADDKVDQRDQEEVAHVQHFARDAVQRQPEAVDDAVGQYPECRAASDYERSPLPAPILGA